MSAPTRGDGMPDEVPDEVPDDGPDDVGDDVPDDRPDGGPEAMSDDVAGDEPRPAPDQAAFDELLGVVDELDTHNEQLRMRVLELLDLMEAAVTAQVAGERRIAELEQRCTELDAVRGTRVVRLAERARRLVRAPRRTRATDD